VTGRDPDRLLAAWEAGDGLGPGRRAESLLAALRGQDDDAVTGADVGSRDVLLARELLALAGDIVEAVADCPRCGLLLDVPVDVAAISRLPVHAPGERLVASLPGGSIPYRLPTWADVLEVAGLPPAGARRALLARCLAVPPDELAGMDDAVADAVESAMEQTAPAGAVDLLVACPGCAGQAPVALDVAELLWAEIQARVAVLLADVHALATAYGWTEPDVLALSPRRRAAYLALTVS
jgi:hypothetical protein